MLDVKSEHLVIVLQILKQFVPDCEVRAFGSRVSGTARPYSDLDIAVVGKGKIPRRTKSLLRNAFAESNIPFRVELLDYNAISNEFCKIIDEKYETIQPSL